MAEVISWYWRASNISRASGIFSVTKAKQTRNTWGTRCKKPFGAREKTITFGPRLKAKIIFKAWIFVEAGRCHEMDFFSLQRSLQLESLLSLFSPPQLADKRTQFRSSSTFISIRWWPWSQVKRIQSSFSRLWMTPHSCDYCIKSVFLSADWVAFDPVLERWRDADGVRRFMGLSRTFEHSRSIPLLAKNRSNKQTRKRWLKLLPSWFKVERPMTRVS